jgi:hypothetical protein
MKSVKIPVPGPYSRTYRALERSTQLVIALARCLELGVTAPVVVGCLRNSPRNLNRDMVFFLKGQFIRTNLKTRLKRHHNFSFIAALIAALRRDWVSAWIPGGSAF